MDVSIPHRTTAGLAAALAAQAHAVRFEQLPDELIRLAARCVLDYLGVTLAGADAAAFAGYSNASARDPALMALREKVGVESQTGWCNTVTAVESSMLDGRTIVAEHDGGQPRPASRNRAAARPEPRRAAYRNCGTVARASGYCHPHPSLRLVEETR